MRQDPRSIIRRLRRELSADFQKQSALKLKRILLGFHSLQKSRRIALYIPANGEIDPIPWASIARRQGKELFLPELESDQRMHFSYWPSNATFITNRYLIPEPISKAYPQYSASELDAILIPLVAFDWRGNRMGMGGGFYDRTLAQLPSSRQTLLIGLAHDFQQLPRITSHYWDVSLDAIATPSGIWKGVHRQSQTSALKTIPKVHRKPEEIHPNLLK